MTNRQYFEAKFLVDADQLERMIGKKLPADADKLQNKLSKARFGAAFKQAGKDTEAFHRRLDETGKRLQSTGKTLTLASAGVLAFGKIAIDAASDLNETQSKVGVVFGKSAGAVLAFGKTAATSVGQSEQQAEEAAATFGNLFVSMKIGQKPAADMSIAMVRLAGDLASFNNASPQETLEALRSGLVGETEPLRKFGINLNDASLRAEATRLQLGKIGPTLTAQQKAIAAYSLILQQSKTAQGDFARTSGGLANQQRIMAAQFKDSSAALGKDFLPIALDLVGVARNDIIPVITKMADVFAGLPKPVREVGIVALVAAGPLVFLTGKILSGVATLGKARAAWVTYRAAKVAQVAIDTQLAVAETGLAAATTASGTAATGTAAALGSGGLAASTGSFFRQGIAAIPVIGALTAGFVLSQKAIDDNVSTFDEIRHALGFHVAKLDDAREAQAAATQKTTEYTQAITDQYPQLDVATAKQIAANASSKDGAIQAAKSAQAIKDYAKALEEYQTQLDQTKTSVSGAIPVFEGFHTTGVKSSATLRNAIIKDLRQEVGGLTTWSKDTQTLLKRGADPAFILELSQKGPQYVHAMATGSNTQLHLAERFFKARMDAILKLSKQQLGLAGIQAPQAFASGMNASKPKVSAASRAIAAAATNPLKLHNVAATLGRETGMGLAQGVNSKAVRQKVKVNSSAVALYLSTTMSSTLGIHSPSTVAFRIGELYMQGLIEGMIAKGRHLEAAAASVGTSGAVALGKALAAQMGWTGGQWNALYQLWAHESGWRWNADNPTSSAYGIPQALPGSKMGSVAGDWRTNPRTQILWGLEYIRGRYGNPGNAWAAWQSRSPHWYAAGLEPTVFSRPTLIGVGERGPETVSVTRGGGGFDYDKMARAVAKALREQPPRVAVDDVHAGFLAKKTRLGGMNLGLS